MSCKKTKSAFVWTSILNEPFIALYAANFPFILHKELNISLLQISVLASLRPVVPILSFYWGAKLSKKPQNLKTNLILAWILARGPFLLIPWTESAWYLIACCANFELFKKSGNPALMELLKKNIEKNEREKIYTLCYVISFLESVALGLLFTYLLGRVWISWKTLLFIATFISLLSLIAQLKIPSPEPISTGNFQKVSIFEKIVGPWKDVISLLKARPEFLRFQYGFMIGGIGLMLASPALPLLYINHLGLSSSEIVIGKLMLMGFGVVSSSSLWRWMLAIKDQDNVLAAVVSIFSIYLVLNYLSFYYGCFFYVSCFLYGIGQAGSQLLWNLSGPLFSKEEESTRFSRTNILMVALRGAFAPLFGGYLCHLIGPAPVLLIGAGVCCTGALFVLIANRAKKRLSDSQI